MLRRTHVVTILLFALVCGRFAVPALAVGEPDTTFGANGVAVAEFGHPNTFLYDLTVQMDGKIVAVGEVFNGANYDVAIARFDRDGRLDKSFGANGRVVTAWGPGSDHAAAVAIQTDGRIVVAGSAANQFWIDFALARYYPDGSLDETFGGDGVVTTATGSFYSTIRALAIQFDGKIIVAGEAFGDDRDIAVARYNQDGSLDQGFGNNGVRLIAINPKHSDNVADVAIQNDGKIVVSGMGTDLFSRSMLVAASFVVFRLNQRGNLDPSFGQDGIVTTSVGAEYESAGQLTIQTDGRILVGGEFGAGGANGLLVRYDLNGSLDNSFDLDGVRTFLDGKTGGHVVQPDGRVILTRSYGTFPNTFGGLTRINTNGEIDVTFGDQGTALGYSGALALQTDGKILLGSTQNGNFRIYRLQGDSPIPPQAGISGRVVNASGDGLSGSRVTLHIAGTNETRIAITNPFGYFRFSPANTDTVCELSVSDKRHSFPDSAQSFWLTRDTNGLLFTAAL